MSKESEIKHLIRDIAAPNGGAALFEAEVVESKDTECTIKYQGLLHKNVRLVCGFSQSLTTIKSQMFHPYENIKSPIHKSTNPQISKSPNHSYHKTQKRTFPGSLLLLILNLNLIL